jgi:Xaa-Pro aminopeptidase
MLSGRSRRLPLTRPKSPGELKNTRKAIAIVRRVLDGLEPFGRRERDVAGEIRKGILSQGARPSFRAIVSTGRNTAFVHHRPGNRIIRRENPLMIDLGARFRGQCSDVTRMYIPPGSGRLGRMYRDTLGIQKAVMRRLRPGAVFRELNEFYRKSLEKKGYRAKHSIGHGLGLRIHEGIRELRPGMVLTVEPGIYVRNLGGCRIEDMVLIKGRGTEILSGSIPERPFG